MSLRQATPLSGAIEDTLSDAGDNLQNDENAGSWLSASVAAAGSLNHPPSRLSASGANGKQLSCHKLMLEQSLVYRSQKRVVKRCRWSLKPSPARPLILRHRFLPLLPSVPLFKQSSVVSNLANRPTSTSSTPYLPNLAYRACRPPPL